MTPKEIVEARAPQLEGFPRLDQLIEIADGLTHQTAFGTQRPLAIALRVLHMIGTDQKGGAAGPVISESEGALSRSYGWSGQYGQLATTSWGLELQALQRGSMMGARNRTFA